MTTPHKYAELIHAFADGKTLQCARTDDTKWIDWEEPYCPSFGCSATTEWRIKPDEPKKVVYLCFENGHGALYWRREDMVVIGDKYPIPSLDREVTLEGE